MDVKIAILDNVFESQVLEEILTERQIPYYIRSYSDDVYAGLFQINKGWGAVYARDEYKACITEILEEIRKGDIVWNENE